VAVIVPPLASFVACLVYTPVPRYAGATMWLLGVEGAMLAIGDWLRTSPGRWLAAGAAVALASLPFWTGEPLLRRLSDFEARAGAQVETLRLPTGLEVLVPQQGTYACWDAPLPCTPYPHPGLQLRHPPDLGGGFVIDPLAAGPLPEAPVHP
jgi:hypothetical protein